MTFLGVTAQLKILPLMYQLTKIDVPHSITILYTMCVYSQRGNSDQFRVHDPLSPSNASADIVWFQSTKLNTFMKMIFFFITSTVHVCRVYILMHQQNLSLFVWFHSTKLKTFKKMIFFSLLVHVCKVYSHA